MAADAPGPAIKKLWSLTVENLHSVTSNTYDMPVFPYDDGVVLIQDGIFVIGNAHAGAPCPDSLPTVAWVQVEDENADHE